MRFTFLAIAAFAATASAISFPSLGLRHRHRTRATNDVRLPDVPPKLKELYAPELFAVEIASGNGTGYYAANVDLSQTAYALGAGMAATGLQRREYYEGELDEPANSITLRVQMGNKKSNAGRLANIYLYEKLQEGLRELCPEGRGACFDKSEKDFTIEMEYVDGKGKSKRGPAWLTIKTSNYDNPGSNENRNWRRELMISAVAKAWEAQSNDKKHCRAEDYGEYCNIGEYVRVDVIAGPETHEGNNEWIEAWIDSAQFLGKFDCVATMNSVRGNIEGIRMGFVEAYHGAYNYGIEVICPKKEIT